MGYTQHKSEESMEDYLEAIHILSERLPVVRSVDIAVHLGFSKPSVSVAMKNLRNREMITVTGEGYIYLTEEGRRLALRTYERHTVLRDWLIRLGVDEPTASADACKMEHDLSTQSFEAIKKFILE